MSKQFEIIRTGVSPVDTIIIRDAQTCEYVCEIKGYGADVERCGLSKEAIEMRSKKMTSTANLLAAAPELLDALEHMVRDVKAMCMRDSGTMPFGPTIDETIAAIAKAKGE